MIVLSRLRTFGITAKQQCAPSYKKFKWFLRRPQLPSTNDGSINLHLGCGAVNHPSFINIDLVPYPHIHYLKPIDDLSNIADESVDLIYASHCLEHFSVRKVSQVLREWTRVLKKGGILRLSVPDFDNIVEAYRASGKKIDVVQHAIVGGQEYAYNFHYIVFNISYLTALLEEVGLSQVHPWLPGSTSMTTFDDWSNKYFCVDGKNIPISLNIEAVK